MDIQGILGMDSDVRNGYDDIKVTFEIDADASQGGHRGDRGAVAEALGRVRRPHEPRERHRRRGQDIEQLTTVVVGAGHAGLAASRFLTERSIDHVLLERGEVANSWRRERWESLRLLTPNWQSRLPGHRYDGPDPDGYMTMPEVVEFISRLRHGVGRAGPHQYERHVGDADGRRVSRRDDRRRDPLPVRRARERRLQSAERSGGQRVGAGGRRADHPVRLSRSVPAARRGRARRRRVGDRRAARRRDSPLGAAGDARGRRARPPAAQVPRTRCAVVDGSVGGVGTSGTTRSTI